MERCAGCGIELKIRIPDSEQPDCWPVCSACREKVNRAAASRQVLIRRLYAAGRSLSACHACAGSGELEIHFITPLAAGGTTDSRNLLLLCRDCHARAHAAGARLTGRAVNLCQPNASGEDK